MSRLSTHVLDTALGRPAAGVVVHLEYAGASGQWELLSTCPTDTDGRCANLLPQNNDPVLQPGQYRLRFETGTYHAAQMVKGSVPDGRNHRDGAPWRYPLARPVTLESKWLYHL